MMILKSEYIPFLLADALRRIEVVKVICKYDNKTSRHKLPEVFLISIFKFYINTLTLSSAKSAQLNLFIFLREGENYEKHEEHDKNEI